MAPCPPNLLTTNDCDGRLSVVLTFGRWNRVLDIHGPWFIIIWSTNTNTRIPWDQSVQSTWKGCYTLPKNTREMIIMVDCRFICSIEVEFDFFSRPWCGRCCKLYCCNTTRKNLSCLFGKGGGTRVPLVSFKDGSLKSLTRPLLLHKEI